MSWYINGDCRTCRDGVDEVNLQMVGDIYGNGDNTLSRGGSNERINNRGGSLLSQNDAQKSMPMIVCI